MNDAYEELQRFVAALKVFSESLTQTFSALVNNHDNISDIWNDTMRSAYDNEWEPLRDQMSNYINAIGPAYVEFLERKIAILGEYLNG